MDQTDLEVRDPSAFSSPVLGLKACTGSREDVEEFLLTILRETRW